MPSKNLDSKTVESFGDEWIRFDQTGMSEDEARKAFDEYFAVFPWNILTPNAVGFDMGCGTGRWARFVAPSVGHLHCVDPSRALQVAKNNLKEFSNISFHDAAVDTTNLKSCSQDFGYSLGVLHHIPDTALAIRSCVDLLKPGAPLLLYLYYAFDNRPLWYKALWKLSDLVRQIIYRLPSKLKHILTDIIAALIYLPLARLSKVLDRMGVPTNKMPLSIYRNHSFYTMRTDARDRFGTPLEQRFTRTEIKHMMESSGLVDIEFSNSEPFWTVVGYKVKNEF